MTLRKNPYLPQFNQKKVVGVVIGQKNNVKHLALEVVCSDGIHETEEFHLLLANKRVMQETVAALNIFVADVIFEPHEKTELIEWMNTAVHMYINGIL